MYGVLQATCGSNALGVDDENDFPNAINKTHIFVMWIYVGTKNNTQITIETNMQWK